MKTVKRCQCGETYIAWGPFEGGDPGMCPRCSTTLIEIIDRACSEASGQRALGEDGELAREGGEPE